MIDETIRQWFTDNGIEFTTRRRDSLSTLIAVKMQHAEQRLRDAESEVERISTQMGHQQATYKSQLAALAAELATVKRQSEMRLEITNATLKREREHLAELTELRAELAQAHATIEELQYALSECQRYAANGVRHDIIERVCKDALAASREPEPAAQGKTSDDEGVAPDDDSDLIPVRHIPGVGLVDAEVVEEHPAVLAGLSGRFPGEPNAAADGASEGSAAKHCGAVEDGCFFFVEGRCSCNCCQPRKPPPEPDDADVAALKWWQDEGMHENECLDLIASVAALLRTREAAAKRQGVREGWEGAGKALRGSDGSSDLADWLDARKPEVG